MQKSVKLNDEDLEDMEHLNSFTLLDLSFPIGHIPDVLILPNVFGLLFLWTNYESFASILTSKRVHFLPFLLLSRHT